jgi:uncharacterized membrane protein
VVETAPARLTSLTHLHCLFVTGYVLDPRAALRTSQRPSLASYCAGLAVLAQIGYPLTPARFLNGLAIAVVLLFALASWTHALTTYGPQWSAQLFLISAGIGGGAELLGVRTGWPFGHYEYAGTLGWQVVGVPVLIPLAWSMMAYPCLLLGRRLSAQILAKVGLSKTRQLWSTLVSAVMSALALTSWDLFLDPQMVAAGHWTWITRSPALPGIPGIPVSNYLGWLLVSLAIMVTAELVLPARQGSGPRPHAVPAVLLGWTWLGSTVGNAVFFDRPAVACWGGLAMGVLVAPYLRSLLPSERS